MSALDDELLLLPALPELEPTEVVCGECHLTYYHRLLACPNTCEMLR